MGRRKLKTSKRPSPAREIRVAPPLVVQNPHAAGIDIHSDNHVVGVGPEVVDTFGAYSADLHQIVAHLRQHGVTTVAMESTGVYWIPLFELLEAEGFDAFLVEAGQLHSCGARPKTDVLDCQWIQSRRAGTRLRLAAGFVPSSGIGAGVAGLPPATVPARRDSSAMRPATCSPGVPGQKALTQMSVKLTEVLSDITGLTGLAIVDAILAGERSPAALAMLASPRCAKTKEEFALALEGIWQPEHLFELEQAHALFRFYQGKIDECDQKMQVELARSKERTTRKPHPKIHMGEGGFMRPLAKRISQIEYVRPPTQDSSWGRREIHRASSVALALRFRL